MLSCWAMGKAGSGGSLSGLHGSRRFLKYCVHTCVCSRGPQLSPNSQRPPCPHIRSWDPLWDGWRSKWEDFSNVCPGGESIAERGMVTVVLYLCSRSCFLPGFRCDQCLKAWEYHSNLQRTLAFWDHLAPQPMSTCEGVPCADRGAGLGVAWPGTHVWAPSSLFHVHLVNARQVTQTR